MYQLRRQDAHGYDTGEIRDVATLEEAMRLFLAPGTVGFEGWWKLSWTEPDGSRVRLLRDGKWIEITDIMEEVDEALVVRGNSFDSPMQ
jgi:hypothetical protein